MMAALPLTLGLPLGKAFQFSKHFLLSVFHVRVLGA
jgi:hypothetical protein